MNKKVFFSLLFLIFYNTTTGFDVQTTGNPLPVLSASTNDFSAVQDVSDYMNIDFN